MDDNIRRYVPRSANKQLSRFASMVWGNAQAALKPTRSPGVEYIDLAGYFKLFQFVFGPALGYDKILVRAEYCTAFQELQTRTYSKGAYVTGQPGIGKTLFLIYLLIQLLGQKRVVAVQFTVGTTGLYALFREEVTFHFFDDAEALNDSCATWALADSNAIDRQPSSVFYRSGIRIIQTTSPKSDRWQEWSKQAGAECYVMDFWTEGEIVELAELLDYDVERMTTLAKDWGCVPRRLLHFLDISLSDWEIEQDYMGRARDAAKECQAMLSMITSKNILDGAPSQFYFCRPRVNPQGHISRRLITACVPTPTLRRLLGDALKTITNDLRLDFFRCLSQVDQTRTAAGFIYESWFHSFFCAARTIECRWLNDSRGVALLQGTTTLIHTTWQDVKLQKPPYYWVAPKGFPGIDSALVLNGEIYAFQVTLSSRHKKPLKGLQKLRQNLPVDLKKASWKVLFVGDNDMAVQKVASQWAGNVFFPTKKIRVPMGWTALDPVNENTPYRVFHDETDPDVVMSDEEPDEVPDEESDEEFDEASMQAG